MPIRFRKEKTLVPHLDFLLQKYLQLAQPKGFPKFYKWLFSLLPARLIGFSFVGGGVMVGGVTFLFVLVHFFHVESDIAYFLQAILCVETNFFLNRFTNWKDRAGNLFAQWVKFHSISIGTLLINQGMFAVLTRLGVHYLVVTLLGVGLAALINYVANDRFVFHGLALSEPETVPPPAMQPLTRLPHVGVIVPVRNSKRTIQPCLESLLRQDYRGPVDIFIVGNSPEQDTTWQALKGLAQYPFMHYLYVSRPVSHAGRDANMKRYLGSQEALNCGVDIVAFLDSQVEAPPNWLSTAVDLFHRHGTEGIAGRSCHHPQDHSLSSLYQDRSLFAEWPTYGSGFVLQKSNFGQAPYLPITANLLLTRSALLHLGHSFPRDYASGWDDFQLAWDIMLTGCTILCTDKFWVYRNHVQKFRLVKQFSSGIGGAIFYQDNPECPFVRRRMFEMGLALFGFLSTAVAFLLFSIIGHGIERVAFLIVVAVIFGLLSVVSTWKAHDWRGMLFPFLDLLHIGLWIAGALYSFMYRGTIHPSVANALERLR